MLPLPDESRLDFARRQLREPGLTLDERRVAWGIIAEDVCASLANMERDRIDTELDAKRVSGGMTLSEFLK